MQWITAKNSTLLFEQLAPLCFHWGLIKNCDLAQSPGELFRSSLRVRSSLVLFHRRCEVGRRWRINCTACAVSIFPRNFGAFKKVPRKISFLSTESNICMRRQANITVYLENIIIVRRASQVRWRKKWQILDRPWTAFLISIGQKKGEKGKKMHRWGRSFSNASLSERYPNEWSKL